MSAELIERAVVVRACLTHIDKRRAEIVRAMIDLITTQAAEIAELRAELGDRAPTITFVDRNVDGFGAFSPDESTDKKALCVINLNAFKNADIPAEELPYLVAETMMHEIIHVLEKWAGVEFDEGRVEAVLGARTDLATAAYLAGSADAQDAVAGKIADWIESGKGPYHEGYAEPYAQAIRNGDWRQG